MPAESTVIVRTGTNEYNVIDVVEGMSVGEMMSSYFTQPTEQLYAVQRDAQGRITGLAPVGSEEAMINYASASLLEEDQLERDCFAQCHLWIVKEAVRVFFNPYIRMVLGLSQWYLDLPADEIMTAADLEVFLRECLQVAPGDDRFALYGNYRSHVSIVEGKASVLKLTAKEDETGIGAKFWQFMMRPEAEDQAHLGITRQSILWLQEPGAVLGSKSYWCTLQGITLFYFREPGDLASRKAITNLDQCQVIYRGGSRGKKSYSFDIVTPEGQLYRCKSPSKRRIEKWIRFLKRCHRTVEINEPLTMEMIARLTAPQTAPLEPPPPSAPLATAAAATGVPTKNMRLVGGETDQPGDHHHHHHHHHQHQHQHQQQPDTVTIREERDSLLPQGQPDNQSPNDMETMLGRIEREAEALCRSSKPRRRESQTWIEHVRTFIIDIMRIDHPSYIFSVIPIVKELFGILKDFSEGILEHSEFVMTPERIREHTELVIDFSGQLMSFYRDALLLGPNAEDEELMEGESYDRHRQVVQKIRRALRQPISKINLRNLKIKQTSSTNTSARSSRHTSLRRRSSLVDHPVEDDNPVAAYEGQENPTGKMVEGHKHQKRSVSNFFLGLLFKREGNSSKDEGDAGEQEKSKRKARIPEEEVQDLSMHSSSHVESNHSAGHGAGVEPSSAQTLPPTAVSPILPMADRYGMKKEQFWREQLEQEHQSGATPRTPKTPTTLWGLLGLGSKSGSRASSCQHSRQPSVAKSESSSIVNAADDEMEESILRFKRTANSGFSRSAATMMAFNSTDSNSGAIPSGLNANSGSRHRLSRSLLTPVQPSTLSTPPAPLVPPATTGLIIDETGVSPSPGGGGGEYTLIIEDYEQGKPASAAPSVTQCQQPTPLQKSISIADPEEEDARSLSHDTGQNASKEKQEQPSPSLHGPRDSLKTAHRRCLSMRPAILITPPANSRESQPRQTRSQSQQKQQQPQPRQQSVAPQTHIAADPKDRPMSRRRPSHHHPDHPEGPITLGRRKSVIEIDQVLLSALLKEPRLARLINSSGSSGTNPLSPTRSPLQESETAAAAPLPHMSTMHEHDHLEGTGHIFSAAPIGTTPRTAHYLGNCEVCHESISEVVDALQTPFAAFHRACLVCDLCGQQLTTQSFRLEGGRARCRVQCQHDVKTSDIRRMSLMEAGGRAGTISRDPIRVETPLRSILKKSTHARVP